MKIVVFYVPFPSQDEAQKSLELLMAEKLIACGNILTSESLFMWKGEKCKEEEYPVLMKTIVKLIPQLEARIKSIHSYEIPAIIHWKAKVNEDYGQWVYEQVSLIHP